MGVRPCWRGSCSPLDGREVYRLAQTRVGLQSLGKQEATLQGSGELQLVTKCGPGEGVREPPHAGRCWLDARSKRDLYWGSWKKVITGLGQVCVTLPGRTIHSGMVTGPENHWVSSYPSCWLMLELPESCKWAPSGWIWSWETMNCWLAQKLVRFLKGFGGKKHHKGKLKIASPVHLWHPVLQYSLSKPRTWHKGKITKMSAHLGNRPNKKPWVNTFKT